jgi:hypothetical protein
MISVMKKGFFIVALLTPLLLVGCGGTSSGGSSVTAPSSSSSAKGKNTLTSVLSSFGENMTVNAAFTFLNSGSTTPMINTTYTADGCFFKFTGFTGMTNSGFVNLPAGKKSGVDEGTYQWTLESSALKLGNKLSATPNFRSLYDDPSKIGANAATYASAFIPEIANTTSGFFDLNKDGTHMGELTNLAKYLGLYSTLSSISNLELNYATLYFSDNGTSFTFHFYSRYEGGFDGLDTVVSVTKIATTSIAALTAYLK